MCERKAAEARHPQVEQGEIRLQLARYGQGGQRARGVLGPNPKRLYDQCQRVRGIERVIDYQDGFRKLTHNGKMLTGKRRFLCVQQHKGHQSVRARANCEQQRFARCRPRATPGRYGDQTHRFNYRRSANHRAVIRCAAHRGCDN